MTTPVPPPGSRPDPAAIRAVLLGVLRWLHGLAQEQVTHLQIDPGEYLMDLVCLEHVATMTVQQAMVFLTAPDQLAAIRAEALAITDLRDQAFQSVGFRMEDCSIDLASGTVHQDSSPS